MIAAAEGHISARSGMLEGFYIRPPAPSPPRGRGVKGRYQAALAVWEAENADRSSFMPGPIVELTDTFFR